MADITKIVLVVTFLAGLLDVSGLDVHLLSHCTEGKRCIFLGFIGQCILKLTS